MEKICDMNIKRNDRLLFVGVIVIALVLMLVRTVLQKGGTSITVSVDGQVYGTYSLFEERTIVLSDGRNQIVIKDGCAYMEHAECPDKLCIKQGAIQNQGESIICLPNKVIVTVNGNVKQEYDGMSG